MTSPISNKNSHKILLGHNEFHLKAAPTKMTVTRSLPTSSQEGGMMATQLHGGLEVTETGTR